MTTPDRIKKLVDTFDSNIDSYKSSSYNETQVRQEFIDPFFIELGWDVYNTQGYAEAYKDVVLEDKIKVGNKTKAPDYSFRIGGTRKFFLEAKKPSVDIYGDIHPAFQLRRYAWSGKLPLSVLTDFEEFAVYDCTKKPGKFDKASVGRTFYYKYTDYIDKWEEIYNIFSREAILKGSFDKYAASTKKKRGTSEVDDAFLEEMEKWREKLARNFAIRNPNLSTRALNEAVQKTIDRIVFLRICEDRGIEEYGRLRKLTEGKGLYDNLKEMFLLADGKYNSGLFHFKGEKGRDDYDDFTLLQTLDDAPIKEIINGLYYPDSPYEFSVLPADILGQVYERFLGKVIRLTAGHQAKIEEKPEVRKAGGVFYTPTYIVDYIVKNTVGKLLENKSPKEAEKITVLDPACGSGSFLLGAYQYLLDWYLQQYVKEPDKYTKGKNSKIYQNTEQEWKLTTAERKNILLNNIYGVDIDSQAVEVTKLSLLLKVLEGETDETLTQQMQLFSERALPDLDKNIKCGNSLIGSDFYNDKGTSLFSEEDMYRINVFDWEDEFSDIMKSGGFDAVIGNPPYGATVSNDANQYLILKYPNSSSNHDTYFKFIEKSCGLVNQLGFLSMIIPNTWSQIFSASKFRLFLLQNYTIDNIRHYLYPVFSQATVDCDVLTIIKDYNNSNEVLIELIDIDNVKAFSKPQHKISDESGKPFSVILNKQNEIIYEFIASKSVKLENISFLKNGTKPFEVGKGKPPQTREITKNKPFVKDSKTNNSDKPLLRGNLIHRYINKWHYNYWIDYGPWLAAPRDPDIFFKIENKIIIRQTSDSIICTKIDNTFVCRDNLHLVFLKDDIKFSIDYILGLLNSKLITWYFQNMNPEKGEVFAQVKLSHLKELPIYSIDFNNPDDVAKHDKMVDLVQTMLDLNKRLQAEGLDSQSKKIIQKQIEITDKQIDKLVYELYELTPEEIKIVEGE